MNACVGMNGGPYGFATYSLGFFDASQRLAEELRESNNGIDWIIYPVVFNFRHGIELALKNLAEKLPAIWGERQRLAATHKLLDNWSFVSPYLQRDRAFDADNKHVVFVDDVLHDLVAVDPNGEAFRFPTGRNGRKLLQSLSVINVDALTDMIAKTRDAFDHWDFIAGWLWDVRCEAYAHFTH